MPLVATGHAGVAFSRNRIAESSSALIALSRAEWNDAKCFAMHPAVHPPPALDEDTNNPQLLPPQ